MFSTCIFCNKPLGANESIEHFPVGQRLAFDASRGRLWVVCRSCERWNLTPLEERWEAIEEAERLFRDTKLRVSTDQIGLAKLRSGLVLVRIGRPQRPEFAAWRYGDQFGRRRRKQLLMAGGGLAVVGGVVAGGIVAGAAMFGAWGSFWQIGRNIIYGDPNRVIAKVPVGNEILRVRRRHLSDSYTYVDEQGEFGIHLRYVSTVRDPSARSRFMRRARIIPQWKNLTGDVARRAAGLVLPAANRFGGSRAEVATAVQRIEDAGSSEALLRTLAVKRTAQRFFFESPNAAPTNLTNYAAPDRLALEMALHEEAERRALEGELTQLEEAWRDAEEIAQISDDMFLPAGVDEFIARNRPAGDPKRLAPTPRDDESPED
jgi:hypothetical protein